MVLAVMIYGSTLNRWHPVFLNLVVLIVVGGISASIVVPLTVSAIAGVVFDQIGPVSAHRPRCCEPPASGGTGRHPSSPRAPWCTCGGTTGPVKNDVNDAQIAALERGLARTACCGWRRCRPAGGAALFIGYTAKRVAHAAAMTRSTPANLGLDSARPQPGTVGADRWGRISCHARIEAGARLSSVRRHRDPGDHRHAVDVDLDGTIAYRLRCCGMQADLGSLDAVLKS